MKDLPIEVDVRHENWRDLRKDSFEVRRRFKQRCFAVGQAMGEYFLASAFEKVLLQRTGLVGLTGLGSQQLFFRGFLDKYGIKPELFVREVRQGNYFAVDITCKTRCLFPSSKTPRHSEVHLFCVALVWEKESLTLVISFSRRVA